MRIWGTPVACMCRKHLLGEHTEMHMFKATIQMGKSVDGYVRDKLLDTDRIAERHDLLVEEMLRRGFDHTSPIYNIVYPQGFVHRTSVVQDESEMELARRCPDCRLLLESKYGVERFAHLPKGGDGIFGPNGVGEYGFRYSGAPQDGRYQTRDRAVTALERFRRKIRSQ